MPQRERVVAIAAYDVEHAFGDGGEDPVDDAVIHPAPLAITVIISVGGVDVALEPELAESGVEEVPPLAVISLIHVEDDRDVMADRDPLDGGG
jgi:hypothetical protein